MAIGHDLKFNVARIDDELFQIHLIVPNAFCASWRALWKADLRLGSLCAARIPRPPPPAAALIITG
jgi:hypothetical protein